MKHRFALVCNLLQCEDVRFFVDRSEGFCISASDLRARERNFVMVLAAVKFDG